MLCMDDVGGVLVCVMVCGCVGSYVCWCVCGC